MQIRKIQRKKKDLILDLTPLIDCVFVILIFFMLGTQFITHQSALKIDLPKSSIVQTQEIKDMMLYIDKNKNMELSYTDSTNKRLTEKVTKENLESFLVDKFQFLTEKNIVINADKTLTHGDIVEIMTISKKAGATSLDIATEAQK